MMIDRIGSINPVASSRYDRNNQTNRIAQTDSISLSPEAVERSELYRAHELVAAASDVRADRIAELKQKIADPSYITDTIVQATADNIIEALGL
ncbi:MAG: flagellar biosynthesis anti-sigma factor FlgM [Spirochaetaceae bacterium]|jgi:negative regulator of flagellin synthesis FlgM|nr:flagellar biosynthesis anti-sigma factor FlgM [Spirochaetaceae bacterium]